MSNDQKAVSDSNQSVDSVDDGSGKSNQDNVSFDTHKRLLRQTKNTQSENQELKQQLADIQAQDEARAQDALAKNQEWKQLADRREEKIVQLEKTITDNDDHLDKSVKLQAFLNKVPGKLSDAYFGHVPLDKIAMNPDTREVDSESVELVVNDFLKDHGRLIDRNDSKKLPSDASRGGAALTYKEELAQCKTQKELDAVMLKRHGNLSGRPPGF